MRKADFPSFNRRYAIGFSLNGKGFIGLGSKSTESIYKLHNLIDMWEYDPVTDSWSETASFPQEGRAGATVIVVNNKAYIGFGNGKNDLWEFDPKIFE